MKITILILFISLGQLSAMAQNMSKEKVLEDLTMLQQGILQYNPALPHYQPAFENLSAEIIHAVEQDSISMFDYFSMVSEISALSNEGHFTLGNWSDTIHNAIPENRAAFLPLSVLYTSNQLYVWDDYSNEQLLDRGDKIVSINGKTIDDIFKTLQKLTPCDGEILTYANRTIEIGFPWYYWLYIEQSATFEIAYITPNKEVKTVTIQALIKLDQGKNFSKYISEKDKAQTPELNAFYDLQFKDKYAILTLPSFDYRVVNKYKVKSKKMYKTIFKQLAAEQTDQLVIDLRNNTGGLNEFADEIVPYILKPENVTAFLKKTVSWEGKEKTYKMPGASKYAFKGKIFVLVNGRTYSAGSTLCRYAKEYANAVIIGEETGTRYEGFSAGSRQTVILPNSNVRIGIPRYHIYFPKSIKQTTQNRGVLPDYEITYSIDDRISGKDLHLEKVISLLDE